MHRTNAESTKTVERRTPGIPAEVGEKKLQTQEERNKQEKRRVLELLAGLVCC